MPKSSLRSKNTVAVAVAATVVGVSAAVLLSGQTTTARAAAAPGSTVRASVADGTNAGAHRGGADQELSADGTAVVFTSSSRLADLETGDAENVYVWDLRGGRTVLISRGQFTRPGPGTEPPVGKPRAQPSPPPQSSQPPLVHGETAATGSSHMPTISGDGRFVAFVTRADNIVPEDDDQDQDLLVCDRDPDGDGEFDERRAEGGGPDFEYFRVSEPEYAQTEGGAYRTDRPARPRISDDASRLVWEDDEVLASGYYRDVVRTSALRPATVAAVGPGRVETVDTPLGGLPPDAQYSPDVSADGRFVVLAGVYTRGEGSVEFPHRIPFHAVVRKDTRSGLVLRVDWADGTTPDAVAYLSQDESVRLTRPVISGDGGEIAFEAEAYEDVCAPEGSCWYSVADQPVVYVVRIAPEGTPVDSVVASRGNGGAVVNGFSPALSGDGRFLAFGTDNAGAHDGVDVGLGDRDSCLTYRDDLRGEPALDLRGLPPTDEVRDERVVCQVVVRDLVVDRERERGQAPRIAGTLVSAGTGVDCAEELADAATCAGDGDSPPYTRTPPSLSHNGPTVAFDSEATDLVAGEVDDNERTDVFVRTFRPDLRAAPSPLDFGEVLLGDTFDRVVRFDHVGTGPLVVAAVVVEDSDEFALGARTCGGEAVVLQQAGSCEVSVTFAPTTAGDRAGTLLLTLRDGRELTVPLRGTGSQEVPPPAAARFAAGPDPLDFGDRLLLSDGPTQTATVTNVGGSPLAVTGVEVVSSVAPNDYAVAADTCTGTPVAANATCQVTVRFSPTGPGDRPAVLRFADDAPGGSAHLIGLTGTGSTPTIQVSPGVTPPGRVLSVTGTGFAPNKPVTITVRGSVETAAAVTDAAGGFTGSVLILPKSPIGTRPVVATVDGTSLAAERPLLVVTPSVSPSDFVGRG